MPMQRTPLSHTRLDRPMSEAEARAPSGARPPGCKNTFLQNKFRPTANGANSPAEAIILKSFKNLSPRAVRQAPIKREFFGKQSSADAGKQDSIKLKLKADSW